MNPFIDENYYNNFARAGNFSNYGNLPMNNNFGGNAFAGLNAASQSMPYLSSAAQLSPLKRFTGNLSLGKMLNGATKTINTANQIIPLVYQVTPMINNARNAMRVVKAVKSVNDFDDVDLDDIDKEVVVSDQKDVRDAVIVENKVVQPSSNYHEMFEFMI